MPRSARHDSLEPIAQGLSEPGSEAFDKTLALLRQSPSAELHEVFTALLDDPDPPVALGVIQAVGRLQYKDGVDLLVSLVEEPGKWFSREDRARIRLASVECLGLIADNRGVGVLLDIVFDSHDFELRLEAIRSLGRIGSLRCVSPLIEAMISHPPLALSAAGALAQIGGKEAFRGLVASLKHEDEMVRSASVWALGTLGDDRAVEPLLELTGEADALLRQDIAWALGQIGGLPARIALGVLCQRDPDFSVRREAARAIQSGAVTGGVGREPE